MSIAFGLTHPTRRSRLTMYIPNKDRCGDDVANIDEWIRRAWQLIGRLFGGCTVIPNATGIWYAEDDDAFIEERTAIITAHVDRSDVVSHLDTLRAFLVELLTGTNQEAVAIELDGELHLIYAPRVPV
jgi:hypothetical protein